MLKLLINKEPIELNADTSISLVLNSPLFETDTIVGSYSFPFTIPATPSNKKIFGFLNIIENFKAEILDFDCEVYYSGLLLLRGVLRIDGDINNLNYEGTLFVGNIDFINDINTKLLPEYDLGDDYDIGETSQEVVDNATANMIKEYPEVLWQFPTIYNPNFYGADKEFNIEYGEIINYFDRLVYSYAKNIPTTGNKYTLVPFPYLINILMKIAENLNYNFIGNFFQDTELQKLILYNNYALDRNVISYYVKATQTIDQSFVSNGTVIFNDDSTGDNEDKDNVYSIVTGQYRVKAAGKITINVFVRFWNVVPEDSQLAGAIVLDGLILDEVVVTYPVTQYIEHNFTYELILGDINKLMEYQVRSLSSPTFDVIQGIIIYNTSGINYPNLFSKTLNLQNHVPSITAGNLLLALKNTFGLGIFTNMIENEIDFKFLKDIIKSKEYIEFSDNTDKDYSVNILEKNGFLLNFSWSDNDDFTDKNFKSYSDYELISETIATLPEPGKVNQIAIVKNINAVFITIATDGVLSWELFTDDNLDLIIDNDTNELKPNLSVLLMHYDETPSVKQLIPKISQEGTSVDFKIQNDFDLQLLFYRGKRWDDNFRQYPMASTTRYDTQNYEITGNYELKWDGDYGLYETFWKEWLYWYINIRKLVKYNKIMSAKEITQVDFSKKHRINRVDYLLKSIAVTLKMNKILPAKLELYKV